MILTVTHVGGGKEIWVEAARASEPIGAIVQGEQFSLNTRCGGRGICEGCTVELVDGVVEHISSPGHSNADSTPLRIRGCQYRVVSERATIHIPKRSSAFYEPQIVSDFQHCVTASRDPLVPVNSSDTRAFAAAVDVGTTTVAVLLTELGSGRVVERAADFNAQIAFGEDVITRIALCTEDKNNIMMLQAALLNRTIRPLLFQVLKRAGLLANELRCISFSGNTTMLHLLAGVDPSPMGVWPFTPAFIDHRVMPARPLLGDEFQQAEAHLLPSSSAYIGADLTAGAVASGFIYDAGPSLLIDVGTNGEILLIHEKKIYACATAAGPAFEGSGLLNGMRAGEGAISHVTIDSRSLHTHFEIIGQPGTAAVGICGSGYVDFLAEARCSQLLGSAGRFNGDNASHLNFATRLSPFENDFVFSITLPDGLCPVRVSQRDVSRLLQAKAAIAAGIHTLLLQHTLKPSDIRRVYLAGGFGTHVRIDSAITCGLLPGFRADQVRICGNVSLAGAYLALLHQSLLEEMKRVAKGMQIVELNKDPRFESLYADHLLLGPVDVRAPEAAR